MFNLFKKKPWVSDEAVKYLMGVSSLFTVEYTYVVNKHRITKQFRNEVGELVADIYDKNVDSVSIVYMGSGMPCCAFLPKGRLDSRNLGTIKAMFDHFIAECPTTNSNSTVRDLHEMQKGLHDQIEKIVNVYGWDKSKESKSNDIKIYLNSIKPEFRSRLMDFLVRLDKCSVPVTITVNIDGTTDEMIGSTLNELAMYEMEALEAAKSASDDDVLPI